jgi:hypothetical protein
VDRCRTVFAQVVRQGALILDRPPANVIQICPRPPCSESDLPLAWRDVVFLLLFASPAPIRPQLLLPLQGKEPPPRSVSSAPSDSIGRTASPPSVSIGGGGGDEEAGAGEPVRDLWALPQVRGGRGLRRLRSPPAGRGGGEAARLGVPVRDPRRVPLPRQLRQRVPLRAPQDHRRHPHPQCEPRRHPASRSVYSLSGGVWVDLA